MAVISRVDAYEVLDSRGNPTLCVRLVSDSGEEAFGYAPSGASTGSREAPEIRDGGARFHGRGVRKRVELIKSEIAARVVGMEAGQPHVIDRVLRELDGTTNFSRIGANTSTAFSIASFALAAKIAGKEEFEVLGTPPYTLPTPMFNVINGGKHAGNGLAIQEFMVVPHSSSFGESLRMGAEVYQSLRGVLLEERGPSAVNVGDEGGYAPPFRHSREAMDALSRAVERAGYRQDSDVYFALDSAASSFCEGDEYIIDGRRVQAGALIEYYRKLVDEFPIVSIEDPLDEGDWEGFATAVRELRRIRIVGDDILVTDSARIERAANEGVCTGAIIKVNQVGTVSDALTAIDAAKRGGMLPVVSHRSGDNPDSFISHLALGQSTGAIKSGAPARGERVAKYNALLVLEERYGFSFSGVASVRV